MRHTIPFSNWVNWGSNDHQNGGIAQRVFGPSLFLVYPWPQFKCQHQSNALDRSCLWLSLIFIGFSSVFTWRPVPSQMFIYLHMLSYVFDMPCLCNVCIPCACHILHVSMSSVVHSCVILMFDIISKNMYVIVWNFIFTYIYIHIYIHGYNMCMYVCMYVCIYRGVNQKQM